MMNVEMYVVSVFCRLNCTINDVASREVKEPIDDQDVTGDLRSVECDGDRRVRCQR